MSRIIRTEQKEKIPIIGHVRIGETYKKDGRDLPKSNDYFIFDGDYADAARKAIGENKPTLLRITFLSNDDSFSCDERYELWAGKRYYSFGDGRTFNTYNDKKKGYELLTCQNDEEKKFLMDEITARSNKDNKSKTKYEFDEVLKLRFMIVDYDLKFGVWQLVTRAPESSNPGIISSYNLVKKETGGIIKGIPFDLKVKFAISHKMGQNSKFPVVQLIASSSKDLVRINQLNDLGVNLPGLLTGPNLDAIEIKSLPASDHTTEPVTVQPGATGEVCNDSTGIDKAINPEVFQDSEQMLHFKFSLMECVNDSDLKIWKNVVGEKKWFATEKKILNGLYGERKKELKNTGLNNG